jgi:hypothetical protein
MKNRFRLVLLFCFALLVPVNSSFGLSAPQVAEDRDSGYNRALFKHWIDNDKNGCDTRAEVLISEAVVKPKVDKKCKISGGKWLSKYDNKSVTNASQLDVDHLVPLAEAWRSGAWAWTPQQRQDFANDLSDKRALIAVTLSTNRSKGDKDISDWVPKVDTCGYVQNWIAIKIRYSLTYDAREAKSLSSYFETCKFGDIPVEALSGYSYQSQPSTTTETSSLPIPPNPVITYSDVDWAGETLVLVKMSITDPMYKTGLYKSGFSISSNSNLVVRGNAPTRCFRGELTQNNILFNRASGVFLPEGINTELFLDVDRSEDLVSCLLTQKLTFKISFKIRGLSGIDSTYEKKSEETEIAASMSTLMPSPTPPSVPVSIVSPGAFCSPAGATGQSANGTLYTCKTSATDTRNRWRQ